MNTKLNDCLINENIDILTELSIRYKEMDSQVDKNLDDLLEAANLISRTENLQKVKVYIENCLMEATNIESQMKKNIRDIENRMSQCKIFLNPLSSFSTKGTMTSEEMKDEEEPRKIILKKRISMRPKTIKSLREPNLKTYLFYLM
jgi:hypothetical protein